MYGKIKWGNGGDNNLSNDGSAATMYGCAGNDTITGGLESYTIYGGDGDQRDSRVNSV